MIVKKLKILRESKVIDEQTEVFVLKVNEHFSIEKQKFEPANVEMFLTHLAMAAMRQNGAEPIDSMDEAIRLEIANNPKLDEAKKLWKELEGHAVNPFDSNEHWFIYMHLINLFNSET